MLLHQSVLATFRRAFSYEEKCRLNGGGGDAVALGSYS